MNADQATRRFVTDNLTFLTSEAFTRDEYKRLHRSFFTELHNKRYGLPTPKDITTCLVTTLLHRGISPDKIISLINDLPIFRDVGSSHQTYLTSLTDSREYKSKLSPDDFQALQHASAFEAVKQHKSKEIALATQQQLHMLEQQVKLRQAEYDSLPSVLDETQIPEPDFDPTIDEVKPWWERFYLKSNPFPRKDGLSAVDQELYESVVVKTPPFKEILGKLSRNSDFLFNTAFLLSGDFGFGKTTFMDYLGYHLVRKDIVPVRVTCARIHPTASAFLDAFYLTLKTRLLEELNTLALSETHLGDMEIEDVVLHLCKLILTRKAGIVVLMDDYHKHSSAQSSIFEFLGMLQILKDNLTRADLKVGFVVSGLPSWVHQLAMNTRLSGFLDSPVVAIPAITPEGIAAVFNHRIAAYCYDTHARTLRLDFVEAIFNTLGSHSGYRDYLNRIITELEHNNISIVNTPITIDDNELESIRDLFEADAALKSSMNKLVFESRFKRYTSQQVGKCLELLVQTSLQGGVSEVDALFNDNRHYFQHLRDLTLIQKSKSAPGQKAMFRWVVHNRMQIAIRAVQDRFGRSISDYLMKLYAGEHYKSVSAGPTQTDVVESKCLLRVLEDTELPKSLRDTLVQAQRMFESIQVQDATSDQHQGVIERAALALEHLLNGLFHLDTSAVQFARAAIRRAEDRASLHWASDEGTQEAFRRLAAFRKEPSRLNYESAHKQSIEAFVSMSEQLSKVHEDITKSDRPVPFRHRAVRHTQNELSLLGNIEKNYFSADSEKHFGYVEQITNYLEERMRAFLYVTTTLVYGEDKYFECVPKSDKKYAMKNNESRKSYSLVANRFDGFTRPQFRAVFTAPDVKKLIVDAIQMGWPEGDWKMFWDLFAEENIATAHKQHGAYSSAERDRYARYCRLSEEFTSKINTLVADIIDKYAFIAVEAMAPKVPLPIDCIFRFGFQLKESMPASRIGDIEYTLFKHAEHIADHWVDDNAYNKVIGNVLNKLHGVTAFSEDLLELEYIRNHYDVTNAEFCMSLVYGKYVDKCIDVIPWFGSSVLIKKCT